MFDRDNRLNLVDPFPQFDADRYGIAGVVVAFEEEPALRFVGHKLLQFRFVCQ